MKNHDASINNYSIEKEVDTCPHCNKGILANYINHSIIDKELVVIYTCPICNGVIIAKYMRFGNGVYYISNKYPSDKNTKVFDDTIKNISQSFCTIYNQAKEAENINLNEICGIGYRKALEFLIKDYAKLEYPEKVDSIESKPLKFCIDNYIDNLQIKECATMATYLGNDETHYSKKWINKDINDLKQLIDLTLAWIHLNELTRQYKSDMLIKN